MAYARYIENQGNSWNNSIKQHNITSNFYNIRDDENHLHMGTFPFLVVDSAGLFHASPQKGRVGLRVIGRWACVPGPAPWFDVDTAAFVFHFNDESHKHDQKWDVHPPANHVNARFTSQNEVQPWQLRLQTPWKLDMSFSTVKVAITGDRRYEVSPQMWWFIHMGNLSCSCPSFETPGKQL